MNVTQLVCSKCSQAYPPQGIYQLCQCGKPLLVRYDLAKAARTLTKHSLAERTPNLWRYREVLPVERDENIVTLGEGFTPLLKAERLGRSLGLTRLYIKDEAFNPTDSFKARGMAVAVSMAKELGLSKLAVPSAGNAAGALAAYAARAGLQAHIFMPKDVPKANIVEAEVCGAHIELVDGIITDCARRLAQVKEEQEYFDVSTLKEPYRIEGKKTMGYELAEQMNGELPDVIIYPTGGGTGLIGMWKAFDEIEAMGWIDSRRPRMVTVQSSGCAPIVTAFEARRTEAAEFPHPHTIAAGLRVPRAIGDFLMLDILRRSNGAAVAVSDDEILAAVKELAATEGLFAAPEGAACLPALRRLLDEKKVASDERIVLFNTASGYKYLDLFS
ncbi:MAG: threonine synthase [Acidobacteria bacterium]|nr:threonine synthase [Acidobacteriota bacterium]